MRRVLRVLRVLRVRVLRVRGSRVRRVLLTLGAAGFAGACGNGAAPGAATTAAVRPSILLVTLDTTRADAVGPDARGVATPSFNALAARGCRFDQAYATVPETLPSHSSLMTGLYPGGHGVHENARYLPANLPVLADRLRQSGYRTSAFVSSFVLARRFGLARGFDVYDDTLPPGANERSSRATTEAALADLAQPGTGPRFLWVHYYDAHAPYEPPEPFRSRYRDHPYLGEIAAMDEQLGRLAQAFSQHASGPIAIIVVGDHGEGLGEHGEAQHGSLLYQATMHVPLLVIGPGAMNCSSGTPVSTRRVYHTILDFAGVDAAHSLRVNEPDVVLGEAMKPFLEYGWQPQVMVVASRYKSILSGRLETYDLQTDGGEAHDLGSGIALPAGARKALEDYPVPSLTASAPSATLDDEAKRRLAALGYVGATAAPVVRKDAPRPADMTALFPAIERASGLISSGAFAPAIPLLQQILAADPHNLDAQLQLATCYSSLGRDALALEAFQKASAMAPGSQDVRTYLALHYARTRDWPRAVPLLEQVVKESPDRATAVEALGRLKVREGLAAMEGGDTPRALAALERARTLQGSAFGNDLDLGVLYLDARRFDAARAALDRALAAKPDDAMTLFKRAQVSVLLREPDAAARIARARQKADATTKPLIEGERLFR